MDFPYDIENLLGGEAWILWAEVAGDDAVAIPANPAAVFDQESPYAVATDWHSFGATRDASTYSRAFGATAWEIQQSDAAVVRKPTTASRSVSVSVAELDESAFAIIEQTQSVGTVAAAANRSAFDEVGMGDIDSFKRYRIAFVSQRDESAGLVVESADAVPPGESRGRFVMGVGWECSITADTAALEQAKGAMSAVTLTFEFFPVAAQPKGKKYGVWWLEREGTIAAAP